MSICGYILSIGWLLYMLIFHTRDSPSLTDLALFGLAVIVLAMINMQTNSNELIDLLSEERRDT